MTTTEKNLALEELKKELQTAKESANAGDINGSICSLRSAVNNYSNFVSDWRITEFLDRFINDYDVDQIIIDKAKEGGLYSVVWFLEDIDKYNCTCPFFIIDEVFNNLREIEVTDVLEVIDNIKDYLSTL